MFQSALRQTTRLGKPRLVFCTRFLLRNQLRCLPSARIHASPSRHEGGKAVSSTKSLILQNPFRWLAVFLDFMELKNRWDPDFNRKEFLDGTKQAISTVLSLIATQRMDELTGLIKREAVNKFVQQVSETLGYGNTQHLKDPDDIVVMPYKVKLQSIVDQNYCDVDMHFLVVKNIEGNQSSAAQSRLLMCLLFAKFHRNYSPGQLPDWTITQLSLEKASPVA